MVMGNAFSNYNGSAVYSARVAVVSMEVVI
jgi:hypothetical protein